MPESSSLSLVSCLLNMFGEALADGGASGRFERFETRLRRQLKRDERVDDDTMRDLMRLEPFLKTYVAGVIWALVREAYVGNERVQWMLASPRRALPAPVQRFVDAANLRRCSRLRLCMRDLFQRHFRDEMAGVSTDELCRALWSVDECFESASHTYPHAIQWLEQR